ncbi:MAG: 16S rRNA (cytosine(1402)-N(4))-methyltransferase RsmH [Actinomycetota bacterium]|nr:16S rRNA (cytosine(1402)-N(4))-methyltransferase RsmH [Actinomycetota bacterium]
MSQGFQHRPVMEQEVVALFAAVPPGVVVDATVGGGGHAAALLAAHPHLRLVGIDRDAEALAASAQALARFGPRVVGLHHTRFDRLGEVVEVPVSGVLFDLGVSSPQLDHGERGFSYREDGPLDMRMDRSQDRTASHVVNGEDEATLAGLIAGSGERRFARRIARRIVEARPVTTTGQLAEVVRSAIPAAARRGGGHPARRVFQAVRMAVNDELEVLGPAIDVAIARLAPGGRCAVLAYHSGEDRIVKEHFLTAATGGCLCPPGLPCVCGAVPLVRLLNKGARKPSPAEVAANRRAESARLRACERLTASEDDQ